jgi:Pvc16 N-terminal domain
MIEQADARLHDWALGVEPDLDVSFGPPTNAHTTPRGVSLHLMELVPQPPPRGPERPPLQLALRYLVTTWADAVEDAHRLLGALVFAAMEQTDMQVELQPLDGAAWQALAVMPRPAFVLRLTLRKELPLPVQPLVRGPVVVQSAAVASLYGRVVGPGDLPLADAIVEVPSLRLAARTDARGLFAFPAVPGPPTAVTLRVRARGKELMLAAALPTSPEQPQVIQIDPVGA